MRIGRAVAGLALLGLVPPALGDLVYFARGGQAQVPATVEGPTVRLDTPDGPRSFPAGDFLAIVPEEDPDPGPPAGPGAGPLFATFWRALEAGQTDRAVATLEGARGSDRAHAPTARCLATLGALAPPLPDPDTRLIRLRLRPSRFVEARSDHVLLLHQAEEAEARERLDLLERVVRTFYLELSARGIALPAPRERLVSVWFSRQDDYSSFLRSAGAAPFVGTQGYYHPTLRVVFAFDTRDTEAQRTARRAIANRRKEDPEDRDPDRQALLVELDWRSTDLGIAAHETIHQLVEASGLAPRPDDFPAWLHEGLAAQYEVVRGGRWAGVGRSNDRRLPDWRAIRPAPRLAPLLRDSGMDHGYRSDRYAESWALVGFLRKTRPDGFRTFLDLLRAPTPGRSTDPDRALIAFRAAFGPDLAAIESEWRRYTDALRTPLEAGRPGPPVGGSRPPRSGGGH